ncbi:hypothetical protein AGABI1DRAFT_115795 [Agaricus bisporus var. burnettii JB137-S8]|uniref:3-oxoacyl-[acyl-carrier-protein] reductase n=1 Tax=Agaricus bisporus var. burnettii (strain JB137-S8 / ATCC MYA-4627 / FGSC 10392) TaxID=597362 RepID=K5X014_AGABU|nr:uncharacterized protein AGABI1DRAFT_115795 [Agaricus bisporus var. burnettii JB137-S8]EKM76458.1 hypothetical protein AGABI1DRAFT_115795 [Agaricus bisporus var. burnettii JB137-S8]
MTTRVALVTGGARGIGRAIALRLAQDGFDVAVDDIPSQAEELKQVAEEIRNLGRRAIVLTEDVAQEDRVKEMVERTVKELGSLDAMIANAGVAAFQTVVDADISQWEQTWAINVRGVVLCFKYAAQQMIKQGTGGRIIAASSVCGLKGYAHLGSYCMTKAAVRSLTQTTALELLEHNITVNAYAPGVIDTAMTRNPEADKALGGPNAALKKLMHIPNAKTGQADDVASFVSYLASPQAHFVTGQTMTMDGGGTL